MLKNEMNYILRNTATVFTIRELEMQLGMEKAGLLKRRLNYHVKTGDLYAPRRGVYSKDKKYDSFELAAKLYSPSYISFESVLSKEGVIFQRYPGIYIASYLRRTLEVDGREFNYRKLSEKILYNPSGVENTRGYAMAVKERAFLDMLYLNKRYQFDNIRGLDKEKLSALSALYQDSKLEKRLAEILGKKRGKEC
ncbi:MAG: hypothetical protein A2231_02515 [Candidatus Firestonebacteria bacterium RIFOXYA2_FULL_40_8]|nr:MAG: hypothetical protein A2231_02515 [Candidatus Firestonebacteria bacterium RIFOXYA2_FULL_40_8]